MQQVSNSCSAFNISSLNAAQREAVLCTRGPLLVLAGAGSGKTRVLTHRIAHMIADEGVRPWEILAITFTNKAAREMRERLSKLLPENLRGMWVCTFHAMCVRILREDADRLGYKSNFSIYDDDDSNRLMKEVMESLDIDAKKYPLRAIRSKISQAKNALIDAERMSIEAADDPNPLLRVVGRLYPVFQERLVSANAMDFDDLLLNTYELFSKYPQILEAYQDRFLQISVDEYQDTNHVQYALTNLLAAKHKNLMVVGDDDQSIYSWRGADITNILAFEKDYPEARTVKLEQNYRSSGHILAAANAVVSKNSKRKEKKLFTEASDGEKVNIFQADDERDEGRWIGSQIEKLHDQGVSYDDIAVFYRTNAQSRVLEDMFLRAGVPYKIAGGTRFFDRAEIRDVMAYLKLTVNPDDDVSALRVINVPRRGIGTTSINKIQKYSEENHISLFAAAQSCIAQDTLLSARVRKGLAEFCSILETGRSISGELAQVVEAIVDKAGLIQALEAEHSIEADSRIENIREFFSVAKEFDETHSDESETLETLAQLQAAGIVENEGDVHIRQHLPVSSPKLPAFMEWLALRSDLDSLSGSSTATTMMTIHSAKGLEFPVVFVAGMEDGIFPHHAKEGESANIEEERRLAYVAITRAEKRLYLSYATTRHMFGSTIANPRSRFIDEIPQKDCITTGVGSSGFSGVGWEKRGDRHGIYGSGRGSEVYGGNVFGSYTRSSSLGSPKSHTRSSPIKADAKKAAQTYLPGDHVSHKTFGAGVVKETDKDTVSVYFSRLGKTKKLLKGFAPLVKVDE